MQILQGWRGRSAVEINFKNSARRKIMNLGNTLIVSAKPIAKNTMKNIFPKVRNQLQNEMIDCPGEHRPEDQPRLQTERST